MEKRLKFKYFVIFVVILLVSWFIGNYFYSNYLETPIQPKKSEVSFIIKKGEVYNDILKKLIRLKLVKNRYFFTAYGLLHGYLRKIKAGYYEIDRDISPKELWSILIKGQKPHIIKFTIFGGQTLWEINDILNSLELFEEDKLLLSSVDESFVKKFAISKMIPFKKIKKMRKKFPYITYLEGFLMPDTYFIKKNTTFEEFISRIFLNFSKKFQALKKKHKKSIKKLKKKLKITDYDILIVASLVEKECMVKEECPKIASVIYNRLKKGMKLKIDPTLVYHPFHYYEIPSVKHRKNKRNPYNTYFIKGLPKTPICNPSPVAIESAMSPANTKYLFFVAKRDGSGTHHFSKTGKEHEKSVKKYLKK